MDPLHNWQHDLLLGSLFALGTFLFANAVALFRLEPLDLRKRSIYVRCLVAGLFFPLWMNFRHTFIWLLLWGLFILASTIRYCWQSRETQRNQDWW